MTHDSRHCFLPRLCLPGFGSAKVAEALSSKQFCSNIEEKLFFLACGMHQGKAFLISRPSRIDIVLIDITFLQVSFARVQGRQQNMENLRDEKFIEKLNDRRQCA